VLPPLGSRPWLAARGSPTVGPSSRSPIAGGWSVGLQLLGSSSMFRRVYCWSTRCAAGAELLTLLEAWAPVADFHIRPLRELSVVPTFSTAYASPVRLLSGMPFTPEAIVWCETVAPPGNLERFDPPFGQSPTSFLTP